MCLALAWSLDDAVLVLGDGDVTDFLTWAALGGVLIGALGPTVGWGRWTTHLIGAAFAALLTSLLVGWVLIETGASPHDLFQATTDSAVTAWSDLVVNQRPIDVPVRASPAPPRAHRVGVVAVRELRGLRASAAAQRGHRHRLAAAGQHVADHSATSSPTSCCTRSRRCSCSSASTRSTSSPTGCAGGSAIHRRSRGCTCAAGSVFIAAAVSGSLAAHQRRSLGATGRGVDRPRQQPARVLASASSASSRRRAPAARSDRRSDRTRGSPARGRRTTTRS